MSYQIAKSTVNISLFAFAISPNCKKHSTYKLSCTYLHMFSNIVESNINENTIKPFVFLILSNTSYCYLQTSSHPNNVPSKHNISYHNVT